MSDETTTRRGLFDRIRRSVAAAATESEREVSQSEQRDAPESEFLARFYEARDARAVAEPSPDEVRHAEELEWRRATTVGAGPSVRPKRGDVVLAAHRARRRRDLESPDDDTSRKA